MEYHSDLEDSLILEEEGRRIEAVFCRIQKPVKELTLAVFPVGAEPDAEPLQKICFSLSGVSKLRDFLNSAKQYFN